MMRKLTLAFSAIGLSCSLFAAPISPEQALQRAVASGPMKMKSASMSGLKLAKTLKNDRGEAGAYIFSNNSGKGFAILSADDIAVPMLGYSDSGTIDIDNLPPSLVWWLNEQAARVSSAVDAGSSSPVRAYAPAGYAPIEVLMTTKWNQDSPYNLYTPTVSGVQSPTGCVATSFAQVMNYFKYPDVGQGTIRYSDGGKSRTMNFERTRFDWDNMENEYPMTGYDETKAKAVATLMKACGYSVQMSYGSQASGAVSYRLAQAAVNYFKYDKGTYYTQRAYYSYDQWFKLIYDNIKNVGPIIYNGRSIDGGHSFVCDGYDGNGYFHFNWGWGGMSDGYYVLDSLNPENQGIGGASGGFNSDQGALLGMKPADGDSSLTPANLCIYGNASASLVGNIIMFRAEGSSQAGWGNAYGTDVNVSVGAIISKLDTGDIVTEVPGTIGGTSGSITLSPGTYMPTNRANPQIELPSLADGNYKVTLATKDLNRTDAVWTPIVCNWGDINFCVLKVEGGNAAVSNVSADMMTFEDSYFVSPLYYGRNLKLMNKVRNSSDKQLSLCYVPVLYRDGAIQYVGDMTLVTVDAQSEIDKSDVVKFIENGGATSTGLGTYQLRILDPATNQFVGSFGDYEMTTVSGNLKVDSDEFVIADAQKQNMSVGDKEFEDVYIVKNAYDFKALLKYSVTSGYLDTDIRVIGASYDEASGKFVNLDGFLYSERPYAGAGQSREVSIPLNFEGLNLSPVYRIIAGYIDSNKTRPMATLYVAFDLTGVNDVEDDSTDCKVEYFNLQGCPVSEPTVGQIVIRKMGDKVEKVRY